MGERKEREERFWGSLAIQSKDEYARRISFDEVKRNGRPGLRTKEKAEAASRSHHRLLPESEGGGEVLLRPSFLQCAWHVDSGQCMIALNIVPMWWDAPDTLISFPHILL